MGTRTFYGFGEQQPTEPEIDGFRVKKGAGTNLSAVEIGDFCRGWENDKYVAYKVIGLPHTLDANRKYAINNEVI